jgi:hypothetical protein
VRSHAKAPSAGSISGGSARSCRAALSVAALTILALAFAAAPALAVEATLAFVPGTTFGSPGSADGQLKEPAHVAVEPGTGNVLVVDSGNGRVDVFAPDATGSAQYLTSFGSGTLVTPVGIAIDQATAAIYVSDSGADQIFKFSSDGAATPTYTRDLSFASPAKGTGAGEIGSFASAIAIDPNSHDIVVADAGNKRVDRFTAASAPVASFDGPASEGGALTLPLDIAVGLDGSIYVVDAGNVDELYFSAEPSHVRRFTPSGDAAGELEGINLPTTVAVDPASGRIAATGDSYVVQPRRVYTYTADGGTLLTTTELAPDPREGFNGGVRGIAYDGALAKQIYVVRDPFLSTVYNTLAGALTGVQVLRAAQIPGVEVVGAGGLTATSAHLTGVVDTGEAAGSTAHFEYSADGGETWKSTPDQVLADVPAEQQISADLSGIAPNLAYQVRLRAANPLQSATSDAIGFTTLVSAPEVFTDSASDLTSTSAALHGRVNAFGLVTTYHFDYGTTTAYGQRTLVRDAVGGNGRDLRSFVQSAAGLEPGVLYHYRLIATNSAGMTLGVDRTFVTEEATSLVRRYEQVSPVDKQGSFVKNFFGHVASLDGDSIVYTSKGAFANANASPFFPKYLAQRSDSSGWTSTPLDPPHLQYRDQTNFGQLTMAVSEDLSQAIVLSDRALAAGGVEGASNLYMRDRDTGDYTLIATAPIELYEGLALIGSSAYANFLVGGTRDFSTVDFVSPVSLSPEVSSGSPIMYQWTDGHLTIESRAPDGTPVSVVGQWSEGRNIRPVSEDGSRIVFQELGGGVYVRENDDAAVPLSASLRSSDDPSVVWPAEIRAMSADGRYVFFTSTHPLTEDADGNFFTSVYRFDTQTDQLELVTQGAFLQASADGTTAYVFPSGPGPSGAIEVWHEGSLKPIGDTATSRPTEIPEKWYASPSGRFFSFTSPNRVTEYDSEGKTEVYLYDAESEVLSCASCPPIGVRATASVDMEPGETVGTNHWPRTATNSGQVFFDTPDQLVSRDVNSQSDVYEYANGRPRLISRGAGDVPSYLADAGEDGRDVFFTTTERLVGQDTDNLIDLYDARVGGGIASQNPVGAREECIRDDCKATPSAGVELPFGGSEGLTGPENVKAESRKRCGKGRHARKVKGKSRCVKQRGKRTNSNRRQGR